MTAAGSIGGLLPRATDYAGFRSHWRKDVVAGLTVAVFGGSNLQVSGPTGAMTVVLVPLVARYGADGVVIVGVMAGAFVVLAALFRLGRYLAYIPWPVIEGFTLGIAVIILLQQVPNALGVPKPAGENTAVVAGKALVDAFGQGSLAAVALVALVVAVMIVTPRVHRSLPASLIAVLAATVVANVAGLDVATIGQLPSSLPGPHLPHVVFGDLNQYLSAAFAIAALAAIESLLSAKVADGMADGPRHDPDRELFGQGLANLVSPVFGGMPATGAIARTAVNVRAGARTRVAAIVHSLTLVVIVVFGSALVAKIPLAALAGVLIVTAVRMVELHNLRAVMRSTRSDAIVLTVTALATVVFDLIVAVEIGVAAAAVLALRHVARAAEAVPGTVVAEVDADEEEHLLAERIVTYRLDGALFFGVAQRFLTELALVADVRVVILRLPGLQVLDATGAQALGEIVEDLEHHHITVLLKGPRPEHLRVLRAVGALDRLAHERHLFTDLDDAIIHARLHAARPPTPHDDFRP